MGCFVIMHNLLEIKGIFPFYELIHKKFPYIAKERHPAYIISSQHLCDTVVGALSYESPGPGRIPALVVGDELTQLLFFFPIRVGR